IADVVSADHFLLAFDELGIEPSGAHHRESPLQLSLRPIGTGAATRSDISDCAIGENALLDYLSRLPDWSSGRGREMLPARWRTEICDGYNRPAGGADKHPWTFRRSRDIACDRVCGGRCVGPDHRLSDAAGPLGRRVLSRRIVGHRRPDFERLAANAPG